MAQTEIDARLQRVERWRDEEDLDVPLWHKRTAFMVRLLKRYLAERAGPERAVRMLDLGCGAMAAEQILATHGLDRVEYIPSDVFPRDHRTLVIDLEQPGFSERLPRVDLCFLGGVLEHLADPTAVLRGLAGHCRWLFFSYCPRVRKQDMAVRRGWKNHLTESQLEELAATLGPRVIVDRGFDGPPTQPVVTYFVEVGAAPEAARVVPADHGALHARSV